MGSKWNYRWPVLTSYDQDHCQNIEMPIGGIGTGTVSLGGRGDLRDWEVVNRPAKGFTPTGTFFALYARQAGGQAVVRAIEGPLETQFLNGMKGATSSEPGLPRFRGVQWKAAYPLAQVLLSDPDVPVQVRIEAFNPLAPADADASGIPLAVLRFVLINRTSKPVRCSVCGNLRNFIGDDGVAALAKGNVNTFRQADGLRGWFLASQGVDTQAEQWGTMALATSDRGELTHRQWLDPDGVAGFEIARSRADFWDNFARGGRLADAPAVTANRPVASLARGVEVPSHGEKAVTFLLTWHFPNRKTWSPPKTAPGQPCCPPETVGNWYVRQYADAWDVAARTAPRLAELENRTVAFIGALCGSDLPEAVKEAALYNLTALRSQSCFRASDGTLMGFEGCNDHAGCCLGSCTHVWNYEQATAFLFGDLSRSMREVEFLHATDERGLMSFRVVLPLERAKEHGKTAADGQMGSLMRLYRDWQLCGDDAWLVRLWPQARKALEFAWIENGWDADRDGVMEGCQHNTTDVEFYGPNTYVGSWYLGALRACEAMAGHVGEGDFARLCGDLAGRGGQWIDGHLFDGEYYVQEIRPPAGGDAIPACLKIQRDADLSEPSNQYGRGCCTDQLVGQYMAHVCGLGHLLKPAHVRKALASVMKYNFRDSTFAHVNWFRAFATNEDAMLLFGTWPKGKPPRNPLFRFTENWTGVEYAAAVAMMYEGLTAQGLKVFRAIRNRFDGKRRSPFNEPECGRYYVRAMASWAGLLAMTGFHYSAVDRSLAFAAADGPATWFWSNGYAWGIVRQRPGKGKVQVELRVAEGTLDVRHVSLKGAGSVEWKTTKHLSAGRTLRFAVNRPHHGRNMKNAPAAIRAKPT